MISLAGRGLFTSRLCFAVVVGCEELPPRLSTIFVRNGRESLGMATRSSNREQQWFMRKHIAKNIRTHCQQCHATLRLHTAVLLVYM